MATNINAEFCCSKGCISTTLKIHNYFSIDQKLDCYFQSKPFRFLDATWFFSLYTNDGRFYGSDNCIGVYATRKEWESPEHDVQLDFRILRPNGSVVCSRTEDVTYKRFRVSHGVHNLLKVSELNENRDDIAPDGALLVKFTILFNVDKHVDTAVQTETPFDKEILVNDFKSLLPIEESTDVTLKVKDRKYKAHRAVLAARSGFFAFMLREGWKEDGAGVIEISDCDPTAFHQFLTYMYCDEVKDLSMDTVFSLHTIAKKYEVLALKSRCVELMTDNLSVDLFCDVLLVLEENYETLRKIVEFYVRNEPDILASRNWQRFVTENPTKANQLQLMAACHSKKPE